jgi:hypothetical protein
MQRIQTFCAASGKCTSETDAMKRLLAPAMLVGFITCRVASSVEAQQSETRTQFMIPVGCPSAKETHEYNKAGAAGDPSVAGCRTLTGRHFEVVRKTTLEGQVYVCARDENRGKCLWVLDR